MGVAACLVKHNVAILKDCNTTYHKSYRFLLGLLLFLGFLKITLNITQQLLALLQLLERSLAESKPITFP
jgi:type III secretory pathway component EscR